MFSKTDWITLNFRFNSFSKVYTFNTISYQQFNEPIVGTDNLITQIKIEICTITLNEKIILQITYL
jgi:hypothetical protein